MEQENQQQIALDEAFVPIDDQVKIGACNMRIDPLKKQKEPTYRLTLDILKQYSCYNAFLFIADVPQLYMQQFWYTISKREYFFLPEFGKPPPYDALVSFVKQHGYKGALELTSTIKNSDSVRNDLQEEQCKEIRTYALSQIHQDAMMNDEIRSSVPYLTCLALSTNTEVDIPKMEKGRGKGVTGKKKAKTVVQKEKKKANTPRKKSSITADDNILPDLDKALKLGESMSLTKAKIEKEEQHVHETHASIIIGREVNLEAKEVADTAESKETCNDEEPTEEALDHSKKLKGIETLSEDAQCISNMKKTSKDSKLDYRIQQQSKGSSEGLGIIPEVLDEPKDYSVSSSSSLSGSDDEVEDVSNDDESKAKEGKDTEEQAEEEPPVDDQAGMEQAGGEQAKVQVPDPAVPNPSSSLTLSSAKYKDPVVQRTSLVETVISMIPEKSTPTPPPTKTELQLQKYPNPIPNILNEVKNQLPKLLPKAVSDFIQPKMERTVRDKSGSFQEHETHLDLYNDLIGLIGIDEAILKGEIDPTKVLKERRHDDKDKDPSVDAEKGKKKRRRKDSELSKDKEIAGSSKKGKAPSQQPTTDKIVNADETIHKTAMETEEPVADNVVNVEEQPQDDAAPKRDTSIWFKQYVILVNAEEDPLTFDDLMGSTVDFTKFSKNHLKKDKITKADVEGPTFSYSKELTEIALNWSTIWNNSLPLQDPPVHLTIPVDFFFNNDLEYLKTGNKERKYAASLTKTKATRYVLKGIEDMIPKLWSSIKEAYDKNVALWIHHWGPKRQLFYRLRNAATSRHEIVVRRADQKEYTFKEADFSRLHLNDIEDMFLLYVQHKLHNLTGDEIVDLSNRKRLMRADELYKFSDRTLKSIHDNLHDMLHNFALGYNHGMPKRA
ncbi:hypothetical protein Tco_1214309 [Tanacetum coccineum]